MNCSLCDRHLRAHERAERVCDDCLRARQWSGLIASPPAREPSRELEPLTVDDARWVLGIEDAGEWEAEP